MTNVTRTIPHLKNIVIDIEEHAESRVKYEDVPHVIEVILPWTAENETINRV